MAPRAPESYTGSHCAVRTVRVYSGVVGARAARCAPDIDPEAVAAADVVPENEMTRIASISTGIHGS